MTTGTAFDRAIHLLYVPTTFCDMDCRYCYMGEQTDSGFPGVDVVAQLKRAIDLFTAADVLPFNVSLHGGEVTTLPADTLDGLFSVIGDHYTRYHDPISARGVRKRVPHIKTNLLNVVRHHDLLRRHRVSVSGSVDLPLRLHDEYRRARKDRSTRSRIEEGVRMLAAYPGKVNLSSTLFRPHYEAREELADDIWYLHNELGYDMTDFNLMIGFASGLNQEKQTEAGKVVLDPMTDAEQVELYRFLRDRFAGTELAYGFKENWFAEFTPSYCTHSVNCGDKFYLLQADGEVYSCVRGQGHPDFHYGNLFEDGVEHILATGAAKIAAAHQKAGLADGCVSCSHLQHCHTGCPFVKLQHQQDRSYTCELQQAMYADAPARYAIHKTEAERDRYAQGYVLQAHPARSAAFTDQPAATGFVTTSDIDDPAHRLGALIEADPVLQRLYAPDDVFLEVAGEAESLRSQILTSQVDIHVLSSEVEPALHVHRRFFDQPPSDPQQCTLYLQLLRNTLVRYGDEQRLKQEHLVTHEVYRPQLATSGLMGDDFLVLPLTPLLRACAHLFQPDVANNLFVTTNQLRRYHYDKQKNNGFYHIQALNLPFQNVQFYWSE